MQRLADKGMLQGYIYDRMWLTVNIMQDLIGVRRIFTEVSSS